MSRVCQYEDFEMKERREVYLILTSREIVVIERKEDHHIHIRYLQFRHFYVGQ